MSEYFLKKFKRLSFLALIIILLGADSLSGKDAPYPEHLSRARLLFNQGQYKKAIAEYKKAEKNISAAKEAILNLAIIHKNLRQYPQAIKYYRKLLSLEPNKIVYLNLGEVYYLKAMPDMAIKSFKAALKMGQGGGLIYFWLGKCFAEKADLENARHYYQKAVEIDGAIVLAHLELGRLYAKKKMWSNAQKEFEKTKELDPSIRDVYPALAASYFNQAKYELALKTFRKVRSVDPDDLKIKSYIEKIYRVAGKDLKKKLAKKERKRIAASLAKKVLPKKLKAAPIVRVLIGKTGRHLRFKWGSNFSIREKNSAKTLFQGQENKLYRLVCKKRKILLFSDEKKIREFGPQIRICAEAPAATILIFDVGFGEGQYWASKTDRLYRGKIELTAVSEDYLKIINVLNLEEYLYGVLPSEMPSSWPAEALKAQTIAARSEAYIKLGRHKAEGFDYCADVHCQAYGGVNVETRATCSAVDKTSGLVAVYAGKPVDAVYSNSCGGHTQDNIFSQGKAVSYLKGRVDTIQPVGFFFPLSPLELEDWLWGEDIPVNCNSDFLSRRSNFRWMRYYPIKKLEILINKKMKTGKLLAINILERNSSAHIKRIEIIGTKGRFIVNKELKIRRLLGNLRSSMFNIDVKLDKKGQPEAFLFYGGGWGHAVGMCQVGAASLAQKGYSYAQILKFYYHGIEIEKKY